MTSLYAGCSAVRCSIVSRLFSSTVPSNIGNDFGLTPRARIVSAGTKKVCRR